MKKSKLKITFLSLIFAFATLVPVVSTGNFCAVAKVNNYNANYKKELTSFALEKADEISTTATEGPAGTVKKPTLSESESTLIYNGKEQTVTVTYDSDMLTESGTKSATDVGTYELTYTIIDANNPFTDGSKTCTLTWKIVKAEDNAITNLQITGWAYGEAVNAPTATSKYGEITYTYEGTNGTNYSSSATAPTKAGTYKVIASVSDTDNYNSATAEKEFTITKAKLTAPTIKTDTFTYDGSVQTLELTGFDETTMSITGNTATNAGSYTAKVSLNDTANYEWADEFDGNISWQINKATKALPTLGSVSYNGTTRIAEVEETDEYTVVTNNGGVNVGKYNVTIKMSDELYKNYKWAITDTQEVTITFEIIKATDNVITEIIFEDFVYGTDPTPAIVKAKYGADNVRFTIDGEETDFSALELKAGSHTLVATIAGTSNYNSATLTKVFNVNKIVVKQSDLPTISGSYVYNGKEQTVSLVGEKEYLTITGDRSGTNAKNYTLTISLKDDTNYEFDTNVVTTLTWSIEKGVNEFTTPLSILSWTYGEAIKNPTAVSKWGTVVFTYTTKAGEVVSVDALSTANAGEYIVTATVVADGSNYDEISESVNFTISKAKVTKPTENSSTFTYNKTEQTYTLTTNSAYTIKNNTRTNAGSQTVIVSLINTTNYEWENGSVDDIAYTFTINKAKLTAPTIKTGTFTYDASVKTLELTGFDETTMSITGNTAKNAGSYTAKVSLTDADNYEWADEFDGNISWSITKASNKFNSLVITGWSLDGEPNAPTYSVDFGTPTFKYIGIDGTTYESDEAPTEVVGKYKLIATVVATENYDGATAEATFSVAGASNEITNLSITGWVYGEYDEATNKPSATARYGDIKYYYVLRGETSYTEANLEVPTNAGNYTVIAVVEGTSEYAGATSSFDFTIEQAEVLESDKPTISGEYIYTGNEQTVVVSGKADYMTLTGEVSGTDAKTYTITITLDSNHKWADGVNNTITWEIGKATAQISDITINGWVYGQFDETINTPTANTTFGTVRFVYLNAESEVVSDIINANAGTYTLKVIVDGTDNYLGAEDNTKSFTITKAKVSVVPSVKADKTFTYNAEEQTLQITDLENYNESIMTIVDGTNKHTNAGNVNVSIKLDSNHIWADNDTDTITIVWVIEKAQMTITNVSILGWVYGEYDASVNTPSADALFGATVSYKYFNGEAVEVTSLNGLNAGTYKLVAIVEDDENANYLGTSAETEFVVSKKTISTQVTAQNAVYTGEELTAILQNFDDSFMTIVENANKHTNAGRYTISIELDGNHTWSEGINGDVEWVIEQKTITTNPTLSETEFVYNGEIKEVQVLGLDGILVSATNLSGTNANTYTVVITINSNYKWAEGFNGTLIWTITKATDNEIANLTITGWKFGENANLPTATAKYGEITYTYEGINGTIYESSSVAPTKVGNYKVTASVADSTNYNSCMDNFEFAISKGNVVVNETPQSKTEGEEGAFNVEVPENSGVLIYYAPTGTTNWSTAVPTTVGVYDVKVVVESTNDNYNAFEKTVVAGFKISAKVEQTPTEPEKQKGLTSSQIGILITAIAIGFIAIALLVAICIHHKNAKRAEQFLDEQDEENRDN